MFHKKIKKTLSKNSLTTKKILKKREFFSLWFVRPFFYAIFLHKFFNHFFTKTEKNLKIFNFLEFSTQIIRNEHKIKDHTTIISIFNN